MKMIRVSFLAIAASGLLLLGCASADKKFTQKELPAEQVKICRTETPRIMKSGGAETALLALVTLAAPGGTALIVVGDEYAKARGAGTQTQIPDFGYLVMDKFAERLRSEKSDWPPFTVIKEPVEEIPQKCTVVEFKVDRIAYGTIDLTRGGIVLDRGLSQGVVSNGFLSKTTVTMRNSEGETLWQKTYLYLSEDFGRKMSMDELEANDFDLLKTEMEFAADKTAKDFVDDLTEARKEESKDVAKVRE